MIRKAILLCVLPIICCPSPAAGQPALAVLNEQGAALQREYDAIDGEKKTFNDECAVVSSLDQAKLGSCSTRDGLLRERMAKYRRALASFKKRKEEIEFMQGEMASVDARLAQTRQAITRFEESLPGFQESLEEWTRLDEEAKEEARRVSGDSAVELVLEMLAPHFEATAEAAHRAQVNLASWRYQRQLTEAERSSPELSALWRALDEQINQAHDRAAVVGAVTAFQHGAAALRDHDERAHVLLRVVGMVNAVWVRNPGLGLLLLDGEPILTDVYAGTTRIAAAKRVEQLAQLSEDQLRGLRSLTELYVRDVNKRHALTQRQDEFLKP